MSNNFPILVMLFATATALAIYFSTTNSKLRDIKLSKKNVGNLKSQIEWVTSLLYLAFLIQFVIVSILTCQWRDIGYPVILIVLVWIFLLATWYFHSQRVDKRKLKRVWTNVRKLAGLPSQAIGKPIPVIIVSGTAPSDDIKLKVKKTC